MSDRTSQTQVFANLAYAYTQTKDYNNALIAFNHAVRLAKDTGDQEAHCLSMEGLAAVYFRMGDYDRSIPAYKEAMALLPAEKNSKNYTLRSERIISKLSDAIQFQVESRQESKVYENETSSPKPQNIRKISNSKRFFQEKQHSLIAKGLEADSTSEEDDDEEEDKSFSKHEPGDGMNFSMRSTMHNKYEQPTDNEVPRAVKEYYLAQVCQEQNAKKNEDVSNEKKESSKMCVVM